ncbi:MAG TPA: substrate-binding domain-containing protein [Phototrophicaceae bacterium]|nr:substrate-binding domain-containing protein [Phototrophicaceae bacterium]
MNGHAVNTYPANIPNLGLITNDPTNVFQRDVIAGMHEIASNSGYEVRIATVTTRPGNLAAITDATGLDFTRLNGVLIVANVIPEPVLRQIWQTGVAISLVSHQSRSLAIPSVMPDNRQGIQMLMQHLVKDCGRRLPIFIQGDPAQSDALLRENAFREELMRYNMPLSESRFIRGDFDPEVATRATTRFLKIGQEFDSVLAADFQMGLSALNVLRNQNYRIPDEIAVVGFGDGPEAAAAGMTTVAADVVELGRRAARQLIGQVKGLRIRGLTLLSTELLARETTHEAKMQP